MKNQYIWNWTRERGVYYAIKCLEKRVVGKTSTKVQRYITKLFRARNFGDWGNWCSSGVWQPKGSSTHYIVTNNEGLSCVAGAQLVVGVEVELESNKESFSEACQRCGATNHAVCVVVS